MSRRLSPGPTSPPRNRFASLPSVDHLLSSEPGQVLAHVFGRAEVKRAVRAQLDIERQALRHSGQQAPDETSILTSVARVLEKSAHDGLRPVFNLTGTVLHTNLGRAVLPEAAITAVTRVARGASNLEFDIAAGRRGDRDVHIEEEICRITGAEAATLVNNNAAAVILVLNTLALGRAVPVSRGELVEIGGAFRIPDIMARAGCRLIEVGTTNRTHLRDFETAMGEDTALVMKVHASNYVIQGFTAAVPEADLANLCRDHSVPFVNDLGSGTLVDLERFGLPHEPTPMDALAAGSDIVTFSGDKLLGGPQAGIIVGRKDLIAQMKANPLKRALRCDKMTIAALAAVLRLYRDPDRLAERLPTLRDLTRTQSDIRTMADRVAPTVAQAIGDVAEVNVCVCESEIGSGALPTRTIASAGISIRPRTVDASSCSEETIARAFRDLPTPVIGRIQEGTFILDLRCLTDETGFVDQLSQLSVST